MEVKVKKMEEATASAAANKSSTHDDWLQDIVGQINEQLQSKPQPIDEPQEAEVEEDECKDPDEKIESDQADQLDEDVTDEKSEAYKNMDKIRRLIFNSNKKRSQRLFRHQQAMLDSVTSSMTGSDHASTTTSSM